MGIIKYTMEKPTALARYAFDFVFQIMGVEGAEIQSGKENDKVHVYYGNNPPGDCRIVIPVNEDDVIWDRLLRHGMPPDEIGEKLPFDVINAISSFLTDRVNGDLGRAYDAHGRLKFSCSYQAKKNISNFPVVNAYILFLKSLFKKKLSVEGIPLWPEGKRCAVGLSHDVDCPDKYAFLKNHHFRFPATAKDVARLFVNTKSLIISYKKRLLDSTPDDFWLFEPIMSQEDKYGFRSTFFLSSVNCFHEWGVSWDVAYDIESPEFQPVFEKMRERKFEIGLHASYNAYEDKERFVYEKEKLQETTGCNLKGLRHHYWHLGQDEGKTLRMHEEAGFEYDSSIGFNEKPGFRRNVALPFYPFDRERNQVIRCLQLPVICMDASLFHQPVKVDEAVKKFLATINILKEYCGLGIINWHVRASYPQNKRYGSWGEAYMKILECLSSDSSIWVASLGEINSWLKKREKERKGIYYGDKGGN